MSNVNHKTTRSILVYIMEYKVKNHGIMPTIREIAESLSLSSTSVVSHHLNKLVKMRLLTKKRAGVYNLVKGFGEYQIDKRFSNAVLESLK